MNNNSLFNDFEEISSNDSYNQLFEARYEWKYLLKKEHLKELLSTINKNYAIVNRDGSFLQYYNNMYLDTQDLYCYRIHHQGKKRRFKMRYRKYVTTGDIFLEIKYSDVQSKKRKKREQVFDLNSNESIERDFLYGHGNFNEPLFPSIEVNYLRATLKSRIENLRVTIDFDLRFGNLRQNIACRLTEFVVIEIKSENKRPNTAIDFWMMDKGIRMVKFSKYCIGIALVCPLAKKNRFKPLLNKINGSIETIRDEKEVVVENIHL